MSRGKVPYTPDQIEAVGASLLVMGERLKSFAKLMRDAKVVALETDGHGNVVRGVNAANDWLGRLKTALDYSQLPHVKDHPIDSEEEPKKPAKNGRKS